MFTYFEYCADVGVIQRRGCLRFTFKAATGVFIGRLPKGNEFDGYVTPQPLILRCVDFTHATRAQTAQDAVMRDPQTFHAPRIIPQGAEGHHAAAVRTIPGDSLATTSCFSRVRQHGSLIVSVTRLHTRRWPFLLPSVSMCAGARVRRNAVPGTSTARWRSSRRWDSGHSLYGPTSRRCAPSARPLPT